MFAKDSGTGRGRGQSSWGNDWRGYDNDSSFGRNQSHDNKDDFQHQGFGRNLDQEDSDTSKIVCQNFLQNKCMRGNNCLFLHPPNASGSSSSNLKRQQNPWLNFCIDFQRGQCPFSDDCRLLHVSRRDEAEYQSTGDIPAGVVEQAMSKAMVMEWAYIGTHPHCKEYLQGACNMRGCNYRHLNTDQYVVEVLAALREKFMIPHDEMFQDTKGSGFPGDKQGGGQFGMRQQEPERFGMMQGDDGFDMQKQGNDQFGMRQRGGMQQQDDKDNFGMRQRGGDQFGMLQGLRDTFGGNDFEPGAKRMRGMDFDGDKNSRNRKQGNDNSRGTGNEDFLDELRRKNINANKNNDELRKTAQNLESENQELRKALRLALDLNAHARNLQEFRDHLREIQATLRKRGYRVEKYSSSGSWSEMPVDRPLSSQEGRMGGGGERYSLNMDKRDFDRMDMQRSVAGRFNW
ncbi:uncharacterized protein [Macrobrachium rosenbergii]|uniref:uncharacterized protein n=1 Tax=Macrobrachium rosenbergii TaxID=79674 RepID=UPI0034D57949